MIEETLFTERMLDPEETSEDGAEFSLRPKYLREYIGQEKVKQNISVYIDAAKARGDALDHTLLYGPPGLGKTTLSMIIANEMAVNIRVTSGPAIEKAGDLAAILSNLAEGDILFIDEIHRLSRQVEEILYPAMEDFALDIIIGKGPAARSLRIDLPHFTLIGATTRAGQMTAPLRDRFGVIERLDLYKPEELREIITRSADLFEISIDSDAALELAKRSRGTPRIANRLLKRARDFAQVLGDGRITTESIDECLTRLDIDKLGLETLDRRMMQTMIDNYGGGPVGLDTIAATLGEESVTIEDIYEPYLISLGFISRTPRGRVLTANGYRHLGLQVPSDNGQVRIEE